MGARSINPECDCNEESDHARNHVQTEKPELPAPANVYGRTHLSPQLKDSIYPYFTCTVLRTIDSLR